MPSGGDGVSESGVAGSHSMESSVTGVDSSLPTGMVGMVLVTEGAYATVASEFSDTGVVGWGVAVRPEGTGDGDGCGDGSGDGDGVGPSDGDGGGARRSSRGLGGQERGVEGGAWTREKRMVDAGCGRRGAGA